MRVLDRRTVLVDLATLGAAPLLGEAEIVGLEDDDLGSDGEVGVLGQRAADESVVGKRRVHPLRMQAAEHTGAAHHVEFPAVGHRVAVRIRGQRRGRVVRPDREERAILRRHEVGVGETARLIEERHRHELVIARVRLGVNAVAAVVRNRVPADARIEAVLRIDLEVHEDRFLHVAQNEGLRRLQEREAVLVGRVVDGLAHHHRVLLLRIRAATVEPARVEHDAALFRQLRRHEAGDLRRHLRHRPDDVRRVRERHLDLDQLGLRQRHLVVVVVAVRVTDDAVARVLERMADKVLALAHVTAAQHDFVAVRQSVAIGVVVEGIRADLEFDEVGEAVVVRVGLGEELVLDVRVVERLDLVGRDLKRLARVARVVPAARHAPVGIRGRAFGVIRRFHEADVRPVPDVILVAVRQPVAVGVFLRRVGRVLRGPELPVRLDCRIQLAVAAAPVLERNVFKLRERRLLVVLRIRVADVALDALHAEELRSVVEVGVVAADLHVGRERAAAHHPRLRQARDERRIFRVHRVREVVLVVVVVQQRREVVARDLAGLVEDTHAEPVDEDIRDAVLVDVAHVVGGQVLLGEHGLDERIVIRAVVQLVRRQRDLGADIDDARILGGRPAVQVGVGEHGAGIRRVAALAADLQPGVEEGVLLLVGVHIAAGGIRVAVGVDRILTPRVLRDATAPLADLVAVGIDRPALVKAAVVERLEARERREVRRIHAALADARRRAIALRKRRALAGRRPVWNELQRLGRVDRVVERARLAVAVLVHDGHRDRLFAGGRELENVRTRHHVGDVLVGCSVRADALMVGDALALARLPRDGHPLLVGGHVFHRPRQRVVAADRRRRGDWVTVLVELLGGIQDLRRAVDDVDLDLAGIPLLAFRVDIVVRHRRRDAIALRGRLRRAVKRRQEEALAVGDAAREHDGVLRKLDEVRRGLGPRGEVRHLQRDIEPLRAVGKFRRRRQRDVEAHVGTRLVLVVGLRVLNRGDDHLRDVENGDREHELGAPLVQRAHVLVLAAHRHLVGAGRGEGVRDLIRRRIALHLLPVARAELPLRDERVVARRRQVEETRLVDVHAERLLDALGDRLRDRAAVDLDGLAAHLGVVDARHDVRRVDREAARDVATGLGLQVGLLRAHEDLVHARGLAVAHLNLDIVLRLEVARGDVAADTARVLARGRRQELGARVVVQRDQEGVERALVLLGDEELHLRRLAFGVAPRLAVKLRPGLLRRRDLDGNRHRRRLLAARAHDVEL